MTATWDLPLPNAEGDRDLAPLVAFAAEELAALDDDDINALATRLGERDIGLNAFMGDAVRLLTQRVEWLLALRLVDRFSDSPAHDREPRHQAWTALRRATLLFQLHRPDDALSASSMASGLASRLEDPELRIAALRVESMVLSQLGRHEASLRRLRQCTRLADELPRDAAEAQKLDLSLRELAQLNVAERFSEAAAFAFRLRRTHGDDIAAAPGRASTYFTFVAHALWTLGFAEIAHRAAHASLDLARETSDRNLERQATRLIGWIDAQRGKATDARRTLEELEPVTDVTGGQITSAPDHALLAYLSEHLGEPGMADEHLALARPEGAAARALLYADLAEAVVAAGRGGNVAEARRRLSDVQRNAVRERMYLFEACAVETEAAVLSDLDAPSDDIDAARFRAADLYDRLTMHRVARRVRSGRWCHAWRVAPGTPRRRSRVQRDRWADHGIVTVNRRFHGQLERVKTLSTSTVSVLLSGESGVGKELVARMIWSESGATGPFVPLNCATIPANVFEAELFGTERGAFTGAVERAGLVEVANEGVLFLDEIGELPPELQAKLLRFLESGEFRRVGARATATSTCRVVSATNRDLAKPLPGGPEFRRDLFYRIAGDEIRLLSLRDRADDVPHLVRHFLGDAVTVDDAAMAALGSYEWPGNVRELRNVTETAAALARSTGVITMGELPARIGESIEQQKRTAAVSDDDIIAALKDTKGNVSRAASRLGVSRQRVYRTILKASLDLDQWRATRD